MKTLWIPVELCQQAISRKELNRFKVFIAMKLLSETGVIRVSLDDEMQLGEMCAIKSSKTIRKHIQSLVKIGWIGTDSKGTHFLRSFKTVARIRRLSRNTCAEIIKKDVKSFSAFCWGTFIGHLARVSHIKSRKAERHTARSIRVRKAKIGYPVADNALAKILKVSTTCAHKGKIAARKHKHIKIKQCYFETGIVPSKATLDVAVNAGGKNHLVLRRGQIMFRKPDLVTPLLRYKRKQLVKKESKITHPEKK